MTYARLATQARLEPLWLTAVDHGSSQWRKWRNRHLKQLAASHPPPGNGNQCWLTLLTPSTHHTRSPDPQQQMVLMLMVGEVGEGVRCSLILELTDAYEPLCGARNRILVNWKSSQFSQPLSHFLVPFRNLFKGTIYMKSNRYLMASIICLIKDFLFSLVNAWILFIRCMYTFGGIVTPLDTYCVCVWGGMYEHRRPHTRPLLACAVDEWRPLSRVFLYQFLHLVFEAGFLSESVPCSFDKDDWLATWDLPVSASHSSGCRHVWPCLFYFFCLCWGLQLRTWCFHKHC